MIFICKKGGTARIVSCPFKSIDLKGQEFFIFTGGDSGDDFLDHHTRDELT